MAVDILTPVSIWKDFELPNYIESIPVSEVVENGVIIKRFFIEGRKTGKGQVKIFSTIVKMQSTEKAPAIIMVKELEKGSVLSQLIKLAEDGYIACTFDIEGKTDGDRFTVYPEDIDYANYINAKENLTQIKVSAKETCFYEWASVLKYAIGYLKGIEDVGKIGVIGAGENVTALWQAVAFNDDVSAFVPIYNTGWASYKGHYKFDNEPEISFPDDKLAFIAGVEPQSYASYVKCPTYSICNINDILFEPDRAHDTIKRVDNIVKGIFYENKCLHGLSQDSVNTIKIFLEKTLKENEKEINFIEPEISSKISNGEITLTIETFNDSVVDVNLFASEEQIQTEFKSYIRYTDYKKKDKSFVFKYVPFSKSGRVYFFATALLKNGAYISTNIECVEFKEEDFSSGYQKQIFYSSREVGLENIFLSRDKIRFDEMFISKKDILEVRNGPQGIKGLSIKEGIISFAIQEKKYKQKFDSILMFDLFSKENAEVVVKIYKNFYGEKKEYFYTINIEGSSAWINSKLEMAKFKTDEGLTLKESDEIEAIEFYSKDEVLINNILWV